jgi:hypothetical protein
MRQELTLPEALGGLHSPLNADLRLYPWAEVIVDRIVRHCGSPMVAVPRKTLMDRLLSPLGLQTFHGHRNADD